MQREVEMWYSEIKEKYSKEILARLDDFLVGKFVDTDENPYTGKIVQFVPTRYILNFETNFAREIPLEERLFPPR